VLNEQQVGPAGQEEAKKLTDLTNPLMTKKYDCDIHSCDALTSLHRTTRYWCVVSKKHETSTIQSHTGIVTHIQHYCRSEL